MEQHSINYNGTYCRASVSYFIINILTDRQFQFCRSKDSSQAHSCCLCTGSCHGMINLFRDRSLGETYPVSAFPPLRFCHCQRYCAAEISEAMKQSIGNFQANLEAVGNFYSNNGVLIHKGKTCAYGRDRKLMLHLIYRISGTKVSSDLLLIYVNCSNQKSAQAVLPSQRYHRTFAQSLIPSYFLDSMFHLQISDEVYEATSDHIVYKATFKSIIKSNGAEIGGQLKILNPEKLLRFQANSSRFSARKEISG